MSKFSATITVDRIMTTEEVSEKCDELGLFVGTPFGPARKFIIDQFAEAQGCGEPEGHFGPYAGEDGRIGWGQSWETVAEELAEAMGKDPEAGLYGEDPEFERVWNAFFQE